MHRYVNDADHGCLAMAEGTTEKIFRVSGKNQTHDFRNTGWMLLIIRH